MKHLGIAILTYFALVLQIGWSDRLAIRSVEPVFLPLVLAVVIFAFEGFAAIAWAAVIGLLSDCLAPESLGIDMLSATMIAFIAGRILSGRQRDPAASVAAGPFLLSTFLIVEVLLLFSIGARLLQSGRTASAADLLSVTAATAAYTAAIGLGIVLCGRVVGRFLPRAENARH